MKAEIEKRHRDLALDVFLAFVDLGKKPWNECQDPAQIVANFEQTLLKSKKKGKK